MCHAWRDLTLHTSKTFALLLGDPQQLEGGSYLRNSSYDLKTHYKKFGTFVRSVPI